MALRTYAGGCPHRIGSYLYTDDKNFNPNSAYNGTTWERVKGRVLAGIDEGDTDTNVKTSFNQLAGKTLGNKYLHGHNHLTHNWANTTTSGGTNSGRVYYGQTGSANTATNATATVGSGDAQNIQPTRLTYIWVRTK